MSMEWLDDPIYFVAGFVPRELEEHAKTRGLHFGWNRITEFTTWKDARADLENRLGKDRDIFQFYHVFDTHNDPSWKDSVLTFKEAENDAR